MDKIEAKIDKVDSNLTTLAKNVEQLAMTVDHNTIRTPPPRIEEKKDKHWTIT